MYCPLPLYSTLNYGCLRVFQSVFVNCLVQLILVANILRLLNNCC